MPTNGHVIILGAGHGGGALAAQLRQDGHVGPITLIGEEALLPYQRPPLSKAWLKGAATGESLALRPRDYYKVQNITVRTSCVATKVDRSARRVSLSDGAILSYDALVFATGARAVRLPVPGADLPGVHVLRTAADAEALKQDLGPGRRIAIIGGGYIGLEVAASAVVLGGSAVIVERESRLLARSGGTVVAEFFRKFHEERGVEIRLGTTVVGFIARGGRVAGVRLGDGNIVDCDAILIGVGIVPEDRLAQASGLATDRGILVDMRAQTGDPAVFAIGDCARRPVPRYGNRLVGLESVPNALEQAKQVSCTVTGKAQPTPEVPWNWSDQFDLKLQIAGLPFDSDRSVVRGDPASERFAVFHLAGSRVEQVEAVNAPAEFMVGKRLILDRTPVDASRLADSDVAMSAFK